MKKTSLSLLAAGVMALAGAAAHADAIFYPDGTSVELGETGADNLMLGSADTCLDCTTLGAGPATVTGTTTVTTTTPQYVYVQPNINWDPAVARAQLRHRRLVRSGAYMIDQSATATSNIPTRAGEASTMTAGVPNLVTDNDRVIVGSTMIPYTTVTEPYYVFSY